MREKITKTNCAVWIIGLICATVIACCVTFSKAVILRMEGCDVEVRFDDSAKYERVGK